MSPGRPTLLTEDFATEACKLARAGAPQVVVAERLRVHPATLSKWLKWGDDAWKPKEGDEQPEDRAPYRAFREAFRTAQTDPIMLCEATWLKAVQGTAAKPAKKDADGKVLEPAVPAIPADAKAAERWLKTHRPDLYRETLDVNHGGQLLEAADIAIDSVRQMIDRAMRDKGDDEGAGAPA